MKTLIAFLILACTCYAQTKENIKTYSEKPRATEVKSNNLSNDAIALIIKAIHKHKRYPIPAFEEDIEGTVVLFIKINKEGEITESEIILSSGYEILDNNTIKTVYRASKDFPKLKREMSLEIPIRYSLDRVRLEKE